MRKKRGFTLAETLITLAIIGIIAAMTVPNLMQNWKKQARLSQLKTAYSILSNAIKLSSVENGDTKTWFFPNSSRTVAINYFVPYLKVQDHGNVEILPTIPGDGSKYGYKDINGNYMPYSYGNLGYAVSTTHYPMLLTNGMIITTTGATINQQTLTITMDVNGKKGPNMLGNDVFRINFHPEKGLYPVEVGCSKTTSSNCINKILKNNWQFPDDYPIEKF